MNIDLTEKWAKEIALMSDAEFEENCKHIETLLKRRKQALRIHDVMHLLPCPFCNGKATTRTTTFGDSMTDNYTVECENGHSLDYWNEDESKAIAYWNDRQ